MSMYDLLIKGGRMIDPAQNIDANLDIALSQGKIAAITKDIPSQESQRVIDASSKIVTPGIIDLHCHVYLGTLRNGLDPDIVGVKQGVTTVVDGGSAGQAIFGGFPKYVIPASRTTVFCFLHIGSQGQSVTPELRDWAEIDLDATIACIESNRDIIKGVKLRLLGNIVASSGVEVLKVAKKVARKFGLPVMLHIGDSWKQVPPTLTREYLQLMEPGDILSHIFTTKYGGILSSDGRVLPELREAMERGVVLEVAHGRSNVSFEVVRKCMSQGILPTVISTDVSRSSLNGPVYGMTVTMSKFIALGLDLKNVIEMSTINPARALSIEGRVGSLKLGMDADISIMELLSGTWKLEDSAQQTIEATTLIAPSMTIKSGELIPAQPVAQPLPLN
ncbi:amidohydrolase/deacetylase family metallohydrolase [Chloroflexota bacterium]